MALELRATPPVRVLLCLGPCHDDFYLPLDLDEAMVCPKDRTHPVAVYSGPVIHVEGERDV